MINKNALHTRTRNAYSFSRYGAVAWMNAIRLLAPSCTEEEVEWILRSKYMRWAADQFHTQRIVMGHEEHQEILDGGEIIKYRDVFGITIEKD